MRKRGFTLVEILIVAGIAAFLSLALSLAFSETVRFQTRGEAKRTTFLARKQLESKLQQLVSRAFVDESEASESTYFIGRSDESGANNAGTGATELIFSTIGQPAPTSTESAEVDEAFEDRNTRTGPQGGVREVRLGVSPLGEEATGEGLFLREQIPADRDPEQGGYERLLSDQIESISFEFWSGETWEPEWDTTTAQERRIPAAVRITYTLLTDPETPIVFTVQLVHSDVTAANPYQGATS